MSLHKTHSLVNIPFSWENQPGISKMTPHAEGSSVREHVRLPPPPPWRSDSPKPSAHGMYVPLPPCAFQPPPRQVLTKKEEGEDPFLAAYRECTRSRKQGKAAGMERKRDVWAVLERVGLGSSCRSSSGVREGVILRLKEPKSVLGNSKEKKKNHIF
ncbi:hypothetical protein BHM03_00010282 [Ensete ventricosum]|uniref:Uncharacterized protein n=1 Tax=Ensete ventricosum TaxID=4639 RepID=A0A445MCT9_ENSVE|nr:hypothetical protein BHM03_00010282 [Ensete ventricosum]